MSRNAQNSVERRTLRGIVAACSLALTTLVGAESSLSTAPQGSRAEVIAVHHPLAVDAFQPRPHIVEQMVEQGIQRFTGTTNVSAAWRKIAGTNDFIGIKVYAATGRNAGTRPEVAAAIIKGILRIGVPTNHIIVWDRNLSDLRASGFTKLGETLGVQVQGAAEAGWDPDVFYDAALIGQLVYGDLEFGRKETEGIGRRSHLTKLLTQKITRIINIAPALNHNAAGVSGNLYSLAMGSADNVWRFEAAPERLATAVPDIYGQPQICDRVVLNISDALICQYQGGQRDLLHYSRVLNELRFSRDPVALDVLALEDIDRGRGTESRTSRPAVVELYRNAALIELGVADAQRIDVVKIHAAVQGNVTTR